MKKSKILKRACFCALLASLLAILPCLSGTAALFAEPTLSHGTADSIITEDMLDLVVPADYSVNESMQADASEGIYDRFFLHDAIQTVSIELNENNLNYLLQNAADKPSVLTESVTIGGETIYYAGLKTKGNYTLSHSVTDNAGSDRFSFTVNFGKYVKKADFSHTQNFYGVSKISFNNFYFDKSMMKEYLSLCLMSEMGVPTPQYGLAKLYLNGEYYGVYFMVEAMDDSILAQYYGVDDEKLSPYLTKPTNTTLLYEDLLEDDSPLWEGDEEVYESVREALPTVMEWDRRLCCLSEGYDFDGKEIDINGEAYLKRLEEILDVDEVLRYFAAHSFLCQMDNMFTTKQNFGLYVDESGRALIIPWDYDLSFGCYYPSTAEETANYDIDIMFKNGGSGRMQEEDICEMYERFPLFHVIYQNESLRQRYHTYLLDCSKIASLGGTTSFGSTYDPAYFSGLTDALSDELIEDASEKLADHVYYMNHISQPSGVKEALSNLKKIVAMRSLGVASQVWGADGSVCTGGCDLSALGNASAGESSDSGSLFLIDESTGIFVLADYGEKKNTGSTRSGGGPGGGRRSSFDSPQLSVSVLTKEDKAWQQLQSDLSLKDKDSLIVYRLEATGTPKGEYTLFIPLSDAYAQAKGAVRFYAWDGSETEEIAMQAEEHIYFAQVSSLSYVAVVQEGGNALMLSAKETAEERTEEENSPASKEEADASGTIRWAIMGALVLLCVCTAVLLPLLDEQRKKKKDPWQNH